MILLEYLTYDVDRNEEQSETYAHQHKALTHQERKDKTMVAYEPGQQEYIHCGQ